MADFSSIADSVGKKYNIDPRLIQATIQQESSGIPTAVNNTTGTAGDPTGKGAKVGGTGAWGPMQVRSAALQDYNKANGTNYKLQDLTKPELGVEVGGWYLGQQMDKFNDPSKALIAYSEGAGSPNVANGSTPYAKSVLGKLGQGMPQKQQAQNLPGIPTFAQAPSQAAQTPAQPNASAFDSLEVAGKPQAQAAQAQPTSAFDALPVTGSARPVKVAAKAAPQAPAAPTAGPNSVPGAPDAAYGSVPDAVGAQDPNAMNQAYGDFAKGFGHGAVLDTINGAARMLGHGVQSLTNKIAPDSAFAGAVNKSVGDLDAASAAEDARDKSLSEVTGNIAGQAAQAFAPMGPLGTASKAANPLVKTALNVGKGAGVGAAIGAVNGPAGGGDQYWSDVGRNSLVGGALGAAAPAALAGLGGVKNALLGSVSPEAAALAQKAQQQGIDVTIPQMTGNKFTKFFSSAADNLPLSGAEARVGNQTAQFSKAVANTIGEDSPNLTQGVLDNAKKRIGAVYDSVLSRNNLKADNAFVNELSNIQQNANSNLPQAEADTVNKWVNGLISKVDANGEIPGKAYQAFRSDVLLRAEKASQQPFLSSAATQLRNATDGAFGRSLQGADADAFNLARQQYGNLKTIESLADKSPTGEINPKLLLQKINNSGRKNGDLADLGRIGKQFLGSQTPDSGTATRTLINGALLGGGGVGAVLSGIGPQAVGSWAAGNVANRLLNSKAAANLFLNGVPGAANVAQKGAFVLPRVGNALLQPTSGNNQ